MQREIITSLLLLAVVSPAAAQLKVESKRIAGSPKDFMEVVHLKLTGSNFEIGKHLGTIAQERFDLKPRLARDPLRTKAQQLYFAKNYPVFLRRMRGVAAAFGEDLDEAKFEFGSLDYDEPKAGCSVVFYPKTTTAHGHPVLSRYYDFSTGTLRGQAPREGTLPATARPYLLELHPDDGHASLAMVSYDLLGVIDGINSEGLCVALLADDQFMAQGVERNPATTAGLGVLEVGRMLLDTCKDVAEAKLALLSHKHYYQSIPCHYLVCDRAGRSFLWEHSRMRNREHIIDGKGEVQITTNFMQQLYQGKAVPEQFRRFHALRSRTKPQGEGFTLDAIRELHTCVAATGGKTTDARPPGRTLWHALYLPEERALAIDFYLGDGASGVRRSKPRKFALR